ncbi:tetratricopeptide repeat protein [Blastopirellula sp. JC732]|uniref:Tetratricopeptide repeat protein n=1 Tax=Blastopirellula sediminis TaxID=2894196 RepID=A0A9X1SI06_9BACT|nr:tetratricopeptide repeat protein [Blastopirellula sediminis]MCC9609550.1 tetratricopeptide repeat protein [Blastopirellula sediminis]MCC9627674.1 tetratricopeptide repeat protein [Blastopirellula sediminis]
MQDRLQRAVACYSRGLLPEALRHVEAALADGDVAADALELKGVILQMQGEHHLALRPLLEAQKLQPLSMAAQLAIAECYCESGDIEEAREIYYALAERYDFPTSLLSSLAEGLGRLQEFELAKRVCETAVRRNPESHSALYGVVFYMTRAGEPAEKSIPLVERLIDLAPRIFRYRISLATLYCILEEWEKAYLAIADATTKELYSVDCTCCIARLVGLFEKFGDQERSAFCRRRLLEIASE